jgi:hypothetical protein
MVSVGTRKDRSNAKATVVGRSCDWKDITPAVSNKSANGKILTTRCVTRKSYAR